MTAIFVEKNPQKPYEHEILPQRPPELIPRRKMASMGINNAKVAKLNSASQFFLIIVLRDMVYVEHDLHSHKFGSHVQIVCTFFCHGMCIVGIYILHCNPIFTLSVSLHWQVLSPNDGPFFAFLYLPSYPYHSYYLKTCCV